MANLEHLYPAGKAGFKDSEVTKFHECIKEWNGEAARGYGILGAPLSKPSISHSGAAQAPAAIRQAFTSYTTYAIESGLDLKDIAIHDFGDVAMHVTDLALSHDRIEETFYEVYKRNPDMLPIILGGDHSISCPSIKAFAKAKGSVGVIQFDAHHDLRNLEDGGPSNGTPFRGLLESGAIKGEHLVQIGIRSFSNSDEYRQYGKEKGVTIYTMKDVRERKITDILQESIAALKDKVDCLYISVDMDVMDQAFAPGCPAIGPGGMDSATLLEGIRYLGAQPIVKGMDIVEIDPTIDFRNMTSRVAAHVVMNYIAGKEE
ncbi:formiminoglutamase [Scopulibacillus darangshiensis]|uniref:Formimidoylglutamase n=1 Tax=Scopulibacillus darangshiensis TaxID=442528 RepID=A0A4R2P7Z1_9BACL|nr:formimidoylglutamase [Scopulibacillus darangshiensis]TCP30937.1 formiminoglutamase [Scopulibacillus darangshiensis]